MNDRLIFSPGLIKFFVVRRNALCVGLRTRDADVAAHQYVAISMGGRIGSSSREITKHASSRREGRSIRLLIKNNHSTLSGKFIKSYSAVNMASQIKITSVSPQLASDMQSDVKLLMSRHPEGTRSTDLGWYHPQIGDSCPLKMKEILEGYSGVASYEIEPHLHQIVGA